MKCGLLPDYCSDLELTSTTLECSTCTNDYFLKSQDKTCIYSAPNCDLYETISNNSIVRLCSICSSGYISLSLIHI